jgi:predicted RNase H-like HicB family nuclease
MMMFPLKFEQDENGTILVTCPLLLEVTTFGKNRADAIHRGADAIEEAVAASARSAGTWISRSPQLSPSEEPLSGLGQASAVNPK